MTGEMASGMSIERVEQPGAGEAVAGQDERDPDAEDGVERHGDGDDDAA